MTTVQMYAASAYEANYGTQNFSSLSPMAVAQTLFLDYCSTNQDPGLTPEAPSASWFNGFTALLNQEFAAYGWADWQALWITRSVDFTLFCWEVLGLQRFSLEYPNATA